MADVLDVAPKPWTRGRLLLLAVVTVAIGAASLVFWLWPRPPEPISAAQVDAIHATLGLVDGRRLAVSRPQGTAGLTAVDPERCVPVLSAFASGLLPAAADGVRSEGTRNELLVAVTTHRFRTAEQAHQSYASVREALAACQGRATSLRRDGARLRATLSPIEVTQPILAPQLAYLEADIWVDPDQSDDYHVIRLFEVNNTVTVLHHQLNPLDPGATAADDQFVSELVDRLSPDDGS